MLRRTAAIVVLVLPALACLPSVSSGHYMPRWQVGDWWIVKEWSKGMTGTWGRQHWRYDVLSCTSMGGARTLVLQRRSRDPNPLFPGIRDLYYFREDSMYAIRLVSTFWRAGRLAEPYVRDMPEGMLGLGLFEMALPRFPLPDTATRDSTFYHRRTARTAADIRQLSGPADTALLNRYANDPDTLGGHRVPPGPAATWSVVSERGLVRDYRRPVGPDNPMEPVSRTWQLWSEGQPWFLYEECSGNLREGGMRPPYSRSWLVASGHAGR